MQSLWKIADRRLSVWECCWILGVASYKILEGNETSSIWRKGHSQTPETQTTEYDSNTTSSNCGRSSHSIIYFQNFLSYVFEIKKSRRSLVDGLRNSPRKTVKKIHVTKISQQLKIKIFSTNFSYHVTTLSFIVFCLSVSSVITIKDTQNSKSTFGVLT